MLALVSSLARGVRHQGAAQHQAFLPWGRCLTCWRWSGSGRSGNLCTRSLCFYALSPLQKKKYLCGKPIALGQLKGFVAIVKKLLISTFFSFALSTSMLKRGAMVLRMLVHVAGLQPMPGAGPPPAPLAPAAVPGACRGGRRCPPRQDSGGWTTQLQAGMKGEAWGAQKALDGTTGVASGPLSFTGMFNPLINVPH